MKAQKRLALLLTVTFSLSAQAATSAKKNNVPHLDPEMTGFEYRALFKEQGIVPLKNDTLDIVLETGKRNLEFFDHLNSLRPTPDKMELWTEANTIAYPMNAPSINNREIIRGNYDTILRTMPADLKKVLTGSGPLPPTSGLPDVEYLEWSRILDRAYQSASRWLLMEPYLGLYAERAEDDVRGFAFLRDNPLEVAKLPVFDTLPAADQETLKKALIQVCMNSSEDRRDCVKKLETSIQAKKVQDFYSTYLPYAHRKWNSFFELGVVRDDVTWTGTTSPNALIPFLEPASSDVRQWLIDNIQDEWKWAGFQLLLDFQPSGSDIPWIRFVAGATANVSGLGGNRITMDANRAIQHYSQRWTIRHEFGHVLGFTDCYAEFYDVNDRVMVNFQLDISNLMCSRRGKFKETHYEEMKKNYKK